MKENALDVTEQAEVFEFVSIGEVINQTLQKNIKQGEILNGIPTGFCEIDKTISGLQKGQLITIAVKPGMGKTAFLLSMLNNVAVKNNFSAAVFSPERSKQKIASRIIESETGMSVGKLLNNDLISSEKDRMHTVISNIAKAKIFLDDTSSISSEEFTKKAKQLKINHNVDLIFVDYLELLNRSTIDDNNREEQLNNIVYTIKEAAKELNVPIVLFSQYREQSNGDNNGQRKPSLADVPVFLSELSDVVMFLSRRNFMNNLSNKQQENVEVMIAKHDNENNNTVVPLKYIDSIAKFTND